MAGVFNNLIMFDQQVKQNSLQSLVPDLATGWSWSADGLALTLPLRQGVRWHDGRPFTAQDVMCTWALRLGISVDRLRINPGKIAIANLARLSTNGDDEVTFHLHLPQPAFPLLLAGGYSVIYPCHVPARDMRTHPIGTGPFKFVEFKMNQHIKVTRNPDYWKPDRPYLDGVEYTIVKDRATAILAFIAGKFDMTFPFTLTVPLVKQIQTQKPGAICEMTPGLANSHLIINREKPPFDNPDLRRAMALSLDRQAFIDIVSEGQGDIGGVLQPPPGGVWGMPPDLLRALPGYDPDVRKNREQARAIMRRLGYGPDNRLKIVLSTRNLPSYRAPAVVLIDQLREVYFDAELDSIETAIYFPRIARKEYTVGLNGQVGSGDPDGIFRLFYGCGSPMNWDNYCSPAVDTLIEQQSIEADQEKRKQLLWTIERKLAEDNARPIIFHTSSGTCWHPHVKGLTIMANSMYTGNRREDIWLDR